MKISKGFTLVELMVTLAIVAIVLAIGVPSFRSVLQNNRVTGMANSMVTSLNIARGEALKRQRNVYITANAGGTASNEYGQGWVVWADINKNNTRNAATEDISVTGAPGSDGIIDNANSLSVVCFRRDGTLGNAGANCASIGTATTFSIRATGCVGENARTLALTAVGRLTVTRTGC